MDGTVVDGGGSPRRGSLNSLHRQSSGSFSHSTKQQSSPSNGVQTTSANLNNLYKDLDKFTKYFIIKTVQVIVQSRIGGGKRLKNECKPTGNDWFNINLTDISEVSQRTKAALEPDGLSVRSNWRVCCEISLKTNDGGRITLEHWIISNKTNSTHTNLSSKLNNTSISPKSQTVNRSSPVSNLSSSSNNGISLNAAAAAATNNLSATNRNRHSTMLCHTPRTRLNSIDDCSGDNISPTKKHLVSMNNENLDIKSSTSCFSLSTTQASHGLDQQALAKIPTTITASPSINSLPSNSANINNASQLLLQQQQQQQGTTKPSTLSSIYTIYNRMSLLLKTLMTTTHIVPAYRLASKASQADSCVICYHVYSNVHSGQSSYKTSPQAKGSIEDVSSNSNLDSPSKRSSSISSFGSVNIKDFVAPDEMEHFCPILKIGSIKTEFNELEVSLYYRSDLKSSNHLMRSPILRDRYNRILDEDCTTAAKQLLAGNNIANYDAQENGDSNDSDIGPDEVKNEVLDYMNQPLRPAFACNEQKTTDKNVQDPNLVIIDTAFDSLLLASEAENNVSTINNTNKNTAKSKDYQARSNGLSRSTDPVQSEPIQVPQTAQYKSKQHAELGQTLSAGSTPKSLIDSFVFVDLNPPFASEEQNDINSFFHGPAPAFNNGFDSVRDVDELTNQLAVIEANATQIDEFIDNICVSESEGEED